MTPLSAVIHKKKKFNQKEKYISKNQLVQLEVDDLLTDLIARGLIDERYRRWFGQQAQLLGANRLRDLANLASQEGRHSARYFTYLVRNDRTSMQNLPPTHQAGKQAKDLLPMPTKTTIVTQAKQTIQQRPTIRLNRSSISATL